MRMSEIRKVYKVPAKRGGRVKYCGEPFFKSGTIKGTDGSYLRILMDGEKTARCFHPVHYLYYIEKK